MTALDFLIVWVVPLLALLVAYLVGVLITYVVVRTRRDSRFRGDVETKVALKQKLRSGRTASMSYPYLVVMLALDNGLQATLLYRMSHALARRRMRFPAEVVHAFAKLLTHIDVSPFADIGPGVRFYHGTGTVIGKLTKIGSGVTISQGVTTGGGGRPAIGDGVTIWAGAKIIGDVQIGDRCVIGANAVVLDDVPADHVAVGVPATRHFPIRGD